VVCKSAETREQRTRSDLKRASHGEDLFTVAETRFGGNELFGDSSEQLEARVGVLGA
jgi:predicted ATPase